PIRLLLGFEEATAHALSASADATPRRVEIGDRRASACARSEPGLRIRPQNPASESDSAKRAEISDDRLLFVGRHVPGVAARHVERAVRIVLHVLPLLD